MHSDKRSFECVHFVHVEDLDVRVKDVISSHKRSQKYTAYIKSTDIKAKVHACTCTCVHVLH